MTKMHDNPIANLPNAERLPFNQLMTLVFENVRPLDSIDSLRLAIHTVELALNGCRQGQTLHGESNGTPKSDVASEWLHSFEMEQNCLQLLSGIYAERLFLAENAKGHH